MKPGIPSCLLVLCAALLFGCKETPTDATPSDTTPTTGSLRIEGPCTFEGTDGKGLKMAIFTCPFTMPPSASGTGAVSGGVASGTVQQLQPGEWCAMAYVDMVETDGLINKAGLDPLALDSTGNSTLHATVERGKETVVQVTFEVK